MEGKKILNWERLWSDLVEEEFKRNKRDGTSSKAKDEANFSLVMLALESALGL